MAENHEKNFEALVESFDGKLTDSDRSLIEIIVSEPSEVIYLSSAALASKADVHASTVVRLAHKLGYDGYPDLRDKIRRDADSKNSANDKSTQRLRSIEQGSNLQSLIESEMAAIAAVANTLSQAQIDKAVDLLENAGTIYLIGRGGAAPLLIHLERRLRRAGKRCDRALNLQRRDLAEHLMGLQRGDALIVFGFQAPASLPAGYAAVLEHAKTVGAGTISIGDASLLTTRPRPDVNLSVSRPDEGQMQLRSGPMLVCEALAMTLASKNSGQAVSGLETLEHLRSGFIAPGKKND